MNHLQTYDPALGSPLLQGTHRIIAGHNASNGLYY